MTKPKIATKWNCGQFFGGMLSGGWDIALQLKWFEMASKYLPYVFWTPRMEGLDVQAAPCLPVFTLLTHVVHK